MEQTFYVGVKGIIARDARVLILRDQGFWDLPGGRIDESEQPLETLERELCEEIPGVEITQIGSLLGCCRAKTIRSDGHGLFLVAYQVFARVPDPIQLSKEHDHAEWMSLSDARNTLSDWSMDWGRVVLG